MARVLASVRSVGSPKTRTTFSSPAYPPSSFGAAFAKLSVEIWRHTNFPDLFAELQMSPVTSRHIRWLEIGVLAWTLWTVRNKLVIQRTPLQRATGALFKLSGFLQIWRPLSHPLDRDAISAFIADLRSMAVRLSPPPRQNQTRRYLRLACSVLLFLWAC